MEDIEDPAKFTYFVSVGKNNAYWKSYEKARGAFWLENEIDEELKKDINDKESLDPKIMKFLLHIIAFFVVSDGKVNENIEQFDSRITIREIKLWYNFQKMMEDIHSIVYSKLVDTYVSDPGQKAAVFNAVENYATIKKKIDWVKKWLGEENEFQKLSDSNISILREISGFYDKTKNYFNNFNAKLPSHWNTVFEQINKPKVSLAKQLLVNIIMEGLFFSGSFCAIFWVAHQFGKMLGLAKANEFISRDEGSHTEFGIGLYKYVIKHKLPASEVYEMFSEAVEVESEFIREALPEGMLNMNSGLMTQYIKFVANQLLVSLGYEKRYEAENPFPFMEKQSVSVRMSDFFMDQNVSEYALSTAFNTAEDQEINTNYVDDF